MANTKHNESNVASSLKVVISLLSRQFNGLADITSAINAINYAGKAVLRLRENITGSGTILGNVMILDLDIPLDSTNSHDVTKRYDEFNSRITNYLIYGVEHKTSGETYGKFGALNVGYVNPVPVRQVVIEIETSKTNEELETLLSELGLAKAS